MRAAIIFLLLAATVCSLYFIFLGPLREPGEPRRRLKAKSQAELLAQVMTSLSYETNLLTAWSGTGSNGFLSNPTLFNILTARTNGIVHTVDTDWARRGRFSDPWGHDYQFIFFRHMGDTQELKGTLTVRSLGPNGVDDSGGQDDIISPGMELN
jgi:hypothetical protein